MRPAVGLVGRAPGAGLLGGADAGAAAATPVVTESADSAASSTASPEPVSTVAEVPAALARRLSTRRVWVATRLVRSRSVTYSGVAKKIDE